MSVSDLLEDKRGFLSWLLTQMALFIAAGVLIGSITAVSFYNDWQKEAEAKNIASNFVASVISVELMEFPEKKNYLFPLKNYWYKVEISADYVTVYRKDGAINKNVVGRKELLVRPYIRTAGQNWDWFDSKELHDFLSTNYGNTGNANDPISFSQREEAISYLEQDMQYNARVVAINPLEITDINEPVFIEKTFIYFEKEDGGVGRKGIVIIHQEG